ncbi:MAG: hypothetical protein V2A70_00980, partial [Candidatus Omnitrophota bacterium]
MRQAWVLCLMLIGASGCTVVSTSIVPVVLPQNPVDRLTPGMTRAEVMAIMDARVVVGYEIDPFTGISKPVESKNLYSSEMMEAGGFSYQVDRYIIRPSAAERVSEAGLFPVVYRNGFLVAKGYEG